MNTLYGAKEWRKIVTRDPQGQAWHVSKSGNVMPVVVSVRAQLIKLGGNPLPHFSVTGEIYNPRSRRAGGDGTITGGAIHDLAVHYFPQCAPLVALHLADIDGVPMHAAENAGYWAGLTEYHPVDPGALAHHLRVDDVLAGEILAYVQNGYGEHPDAYDAITTPGGAFRDAIEHFCLYDMWRAEANAGRALLNPVDSLAVA